MRLRVSWTVLGFFGLVLGLSSARAVGDHHIPAGVTLNVLTLQTLDSGSAWSGMTVRAVVDDPIDVSGRIVLPRGAPARLEVVEVTRSPNLESPDRITLRLLWIESRDRLSWVATNELQFEGLRAHLRIPAETRMQFRLNTFARVE